MYINAYCIRLSKAKSIMRSIIIMKKVNLTSLEEKLDQSHFSVEKDRFSL